MKDSDSVVYGYLAKKVMDDLRNKGSLKPELAKELLQKRFAEHLRNEVQKKDKMMLLSILNSGPVHMRGLVSSLLYKLEIDKAVQQAILELWRKTKKYATKHALLWRLLDFRNDNNQLRDQLHREIYEFIARNWDNFIAFTTSYSGGSDRIMGYVMEQLEKINKGHFPKEKTWVYLCVACASNDKTSVLKLFDKYKKSEVPIVKELVNELIKARNIA